MRLDVVIPTYNRASMLARTLRSILDADQPAGLTVNVYAADNNSTDDTRATVESMMPAFSGRLHYVHAAVQGRSAALNAGIRAGTGDLVGMIDDDETVDAAWLTVIADAFRDASLDFIGGPCRPDFSLAEPAWLPREYPSVIGVIDGGPDVRTFGRDYPGMLMGGNAVIRRSTLDRVGPYNETLGRTDRGLLSGEDDDFFRRLLRAGAVGRYLPDLAIDHHVPPERLTKRYFRRWCYYHGISMGELDRVNRQPTAYLAGVPRHMLGTVVREWRGVLQRMLRRGSVPDRTFAAELKLWSLAGFYRGRLLGKPR